MVSRARPSDIDATGSQQSLSEEQVRILELENQVDTLIAERDNTLTKLTAKEDELAAFMAMASVNEQALRLTDKQRAEWICVFRRAREILKGTGT